MPIEINIKKDNRIVVLNIPGKTPIRSRNSSFNFHSSMELQCIAYASCFANEFWKYCHFNDIDPAIFESFTVTMETFKLILTVQHPKDITDELKDNIIYLSEHCEIAKNWKPGVEIRLIENETPVEILTDDSRKGGCCGH